MRDYMLAQYTKQPTSVVRDPEQREKVQCSLISSFTSNLQLAFSVHSLRIQAIRIYQSLARLLEDFPATKDAHFILGEPRSHEAANKFSFNTHYAMDHSGRLLGGDMHKSKPHQLLSRDGKVLLNLFYLPHFTEVSVVRSKTFLL